MLEVECRIPTAFQRRVLQILAACGPCPLTTVKRHCHCRGRAVETAMHLLRLGGFARRCGQREYDVTNAARCWLAACDSPRPADRPPPHETAAVATLG
jgi:hypothetical protein